VEAVSGRLNIESLTSTERVYPHRALPGSPPVRFDRNDAPDFRLHDTIPRWPGDNRYAWPRPL
jgi:hypothetical protein